MPTIEVKSMEAKSTEANFAGANVKDLTVTYDD